MAWAPKGEIPLRIRGEWLSPRWPEPKVVEPEACAVDTPYTLHIFDHLGKPMAMAARAPEGI